MKQKVYQANCTEHGVPFCFDFKTAETDKKKLMKIASFEASQWGGECHSVEESDTHPDNAYNADKCKNTTQE